MANAIGAVQPNSYDDVKSVGSHAINQLVVDVHYKGFVFELCERVAV